MPMTSGVFTVSCVFHNTAHDVPNDDVRRKTGRTPVTSTLMTKRWRLFGHTARANLAQCVWVACKVRALKVAISRLPPDLEHSRDRWRCSWLHIIELDFRQHNLGLSSAWKRAHVRSKCIKSWNSCVRHKTRYSMTTIEADRQTGVNSWYMFGEQLLCDFADLGGSAMPSYIHQQQIWGLPSDDIVNSKDD